MTHDTITPERREIPGFQGRYLINRAGVLFAADGRLLHAAATTEDRIALLWEANDEVGEYFTVARLIEKTFE